eukprot:2147506-Prymnesium_polylepis.1
MTRAAAKQRAQTDPRVVMPGGTGTGSGVGGATPAAAAAKKKRPPSPHKAAKAYAHHHGCRPTALQPYPVRRTAVPPNYRGGFSGSTGAVVSKRRSVRPAAVVRARPVERDVLMRGRTAEPEVGVGSRKRNEDPPPMHRGRPVESRST